jgi:hypothetical protein
MQNMIVCDGGAFSPHCRQEGERKRRVRERGRERRRKEIDTRDKTSPRTCP